MIINTDYIRNYRPIAKNIDEARVEVYINEAEQLDIIPAIGAEEYQRLADESVILTEDERLLLNGGYYDGEEHCGGMRRIAGIKAALAYLAYARFVRNHSTQVTPFGVVVKMGDESNPATDRGIATVADDAKSIGEAYLHEAVEYWQSVRSCCATRKTKQSRRFVAIGD